MRLKDFVEAWCYTATAVGELDLLETFFITIGGSEYSLFEITEFAHPGKVDIERFDLKGPRMMCHTFVTPRRIARPPI